MILKELMNLANSHLDDQTNQAIITIHAYFDSLQIEDLKKAGYLLILNFYKYLKNNQLQHYVMVIKRMIPKRKERNVMF